MQKRTRPMISHIFSAAVAVAAFSGSLAHAEPTSNTDSAEAQLPRDTRLLAAYLKGYTYVLSRPVVGYHWSVTGSEQAKLNTRIASSDPAGHSYLKSIVEKYWTPAKENPTPADDADLGDHLYGPGAYIEFEPVSRSSQAKVRDKRDWVLLQIQIARGLRVIDLSRDGQNSFPQRIEKILRDANCREGSESTGLKLQSLLGPKTPECLKLMRTVLGTVLKVDGFLHSSSTFSLNECKTRKQSDPDDPDTATEETNRLRGTGLVLMKLDAISPSQVKVFNRASSDDFADRLRIQSYIYKAKRDDAYDAFSDTADSALSYARSQLYDIAPKYRMMNRTCQSFEPGVGCHDKITVCRQKDYKTVDKKRCKTLKPLLWPAYPVEMSQTNVPSMQYDREKKQVPLFWSDMDGKTTDPQIGPWAKENILGCQDIEYYNLLR